MGMILHPIRSSFRLVRSACACTRGLTSVELAVALPVMAGLLLSGLELTRYVFIHQKTERTATTIADLVAREEIMTQNKLDDVFEITEQMLSPFHNAPGTSVIVSSITRMPNESAQVAWQRSWGPDPAGSNIGSEGDAANLPNGMEIEVGDNVITAEVFYEFEPVFAPDLLSENTIYKQAVYRPRFSSLATLIEN